MYVLSMPNIAEQIGRNLRRVREARGLTQADMAQLCGWSQSQLSEMENGGRMASVQKIGDRLEAAGFDPLQLLAPEQSEEVPRAIVDAMAALEAMPPRVQEAAADLLRAVKDHYAADDAEVQDLLSALSGLDPTTRKGVLHAARMMARGMSIPRSAGGIE